ncbi:MAG: polysaccharide biosynthesis/export family protein [Deferribacteres bacterium]|nr:polysaccharide biosynthesis/export family protein [candidate division KSB1 bacterium]MCB9503345.1 polysaccharide biosynthesis/export family protein [Deferribacteres bacterium]
MIKDRSLRLPLVTLLILLTLQINGLQAQLPETNDFHSGDGVRIIVWQEPGSESANLEKLDISNDYIIDSNGQMLLPLIGQVHISGRTKTELANYLQERYSVYASGLHFITKPLIRVALLGAVQKPGMYLVEPQSSLWELISQAEGPQADADLEKIFISRSGEIVGENLLKKAEDAYTLEELGVQSGDQVTVLNHKKFDWRVLLSLGSFIISIINLTIQLQRK